MTPESPKPRPSIAAPVLGVLVALLGYPLVTGGLRVVNMRAVISPAYFACGLVYIVAGGAMIIGGIWTLISLGKSRTPLWICGSGALVSGMVTLIGVLTYVIPCSGPS